MSIAILGLGNMGKGLAKRLAGKTDIVFGAHDNAAATTFAGLLPGHIKVANYHDAAKISDIIILALPYAAALAEAGSNRAFDDKILVDITNPVNADYSGLLMGHSTSAAEEIQKAAPRAKVVKAFNTIFSSLFDAPPAATANVPVFVAGNDAAAVGIVAALARTAGFASEEVGDLSQARLLEPLGMLNIRMGFGLGKGTGIAPNWVTVG
ncbi:NADPH-dependent F420 reductase [Paradevosia shaoguanensis]|uniref:NAD(P)-binding domain-containing protein n=1 Tax=Paradevosia shaoguanensis TaxID=1335043 RepID=A0AA41UCV6_9HYPH|nr:NAD(P)-binding domain-containing protein [Paradevosia shaoguanensis]MBI4048893.1 NAD(P)-binding domain-containing protein [Devosia nanyangense]QMV03839.1 oxidoreductase [Devosia sp. D6-9]CDP50527.1 Putative reductase [Devosia sp. DBB001]MCF1744169.1 NAD(P)-binding domain-containing protein [Paradevosia shaoguanensis]MCI0128652.1 NAD(P)-binding domain-containing protein [Paradevosia shaoguanensis]